MAETTHRFAWSYGFECYDLRCRISERGVGTFIVTVMENLTELERREISVSDQGAFARVWEAAATMQRRYFSRAYRAWHHARERQRFQ
jgi:hypothetical protein